MRPSTRPRVGLMAVTRAFLPRMQQRRSGRIVTFERRRPRHPPYLVSTTDEVRGRVAVRGAPLRAQGVRHRRHADRARRVRTTSRRPWRGPRRVRGHAVRRAVAIRGALEAGRSVRIEPDRDRQGDRACGLRPPPAARYVAPRTYFAIWMNAILPQPSGTGRCAGSADSTPRTSTSAVRCRAGGAAVPGDDGPRRPTAARAPRPRTDRVGPRRLGCGRLAWHFRACAASPSC